MITNLHALKFEIKQQTLFRDLLNILTAVLNCKQVTASLSADSISLAASACRRKELASGFDILL